jgi:hypothetical protein
MSVHNVSATSGYSLISVDAATINGTANVYVYNISHSGLPSTASITYITVAAGSSGGEVIIKDFVYQLTHVSAGVISLTGGNSVLIENINTKRILPNESGTANESISGFL